MIGMISKLFPRPYETKTRFENHPSPGTRRYHDFKIIRVRERDETRSLISTESEIPGQKSRGNKTSPGVSSHSVSYQSVTRPEILDESESGNTEFVVSSTSPSPGI